MYDIYVNVDCDMTALTYSLLSLLLWWVTLQDPSLCSLFACSWRSEYIPYITNSGHVKEPHIFRVLPAQLLISFLVFRVDN